MPTVIRSASSNDLDSLLQVHQAAFGGKLEEANLVQLLHERQKAVVSLLASSDNCVVGSVVFSPVELDPPDSKFHAVGLAPVAVLPEFQRQGIGSLLIQEGMRICKENNFNAIVVLGNPAYYSRFGFVRASNFGLKNEYKVNDEFMVLELEEHILQQVQGTIKFGPEFQEAEC